MKTLILPLLLIVPFYILGQANLNKLTVEQLIQQIKKHRLKRDFDTAHTTAKQALKTAELQQDSLGMGNSYLQIALINKSLNHLDVAFDNFQAALTFFPFENKERRASVYTSLAGLMERRQRNREGLKFIERAINYWPQDSIVKRATTYITKANLLDNLTRLDSAVIYNRKAIDLLERSSDEIKNQAILQINLAKAYYGLGNRLSDMGDYKKGDSCYYQALTWFKKYDDIPLQAYIYENLGLNAQGQNDYGGAEKFFLQSEQLFKTLQDSSGLSNLYYNWTLLHQEREEVKQALEKSQLSLDYFKDGPADFKDLITSTISLSEQYLALYNTRIWAMILIGFLIGIAIYIWMTKQRKVIQVQKQLIKEKEHTITLQQEKIDAEQKTQEAQADFLKLKKKVGDIRHAIIKNSVTSMNISMRSIPSHIRVQTPELLAIQTLIENLQEVVSQRFEELEIDVFRQNQKLRTFTKKMYARVKSLCPMISIDFLEELDYEPDLNLSPRVQFCLENIILNIFGNICKHADCKAASLSFYIDEEGLEINMRDDGKGFDLDEITKNTRGQGLKDIKADVKSLHGRINIQTATNEGTYIKIVIPFEELEN